jgi:hypothetical protein
LEAQVNWADLNPLKRARPAESGKVYVGADPEQPHVGLSIFTEAKTSRAFIVEGRVGPIKAELCGKLFDWDKVPAKYITSLKVGGTVAIPLDRLKSLIR